ncbi:hypothetical protein [Mycobacterium aquaticum]|uniref:hypothetical protein n=1 Tax=Mycobacterium aquaticum TaxID=1927124 RepID=UPI001FE71B7D|nr:hypothetical protein [Mycobacterium aquaticum]
MLIRDLFKRPESSLVRAINDGQPGWSPTDHLIADLWALLLRVNSNPNSPHPDHPVRAAMEEKARAAAHAARIAELKADYAKRKRAYSKEIREEAM